MSLEVDGFEDLMRNLKNLSGSIDQKTEAKAIKSGMKVIADAYREQADRIKDDGALLEGIKESEVVNGIGSVYNTAPHTHLVEFGRSSGQTTYKDKNGVERPVKWGSTAPNPIFEKSYLNNKNKAFKEVAKVIKEELNL